MEIDEYETLVNELELRVDRLRSLFDQYFMGIERTTPNVPHKDVERRIQALRREQIRNTGLRFRFQMILQRYGTYQTYWQRICRQIEEGTYKRHVQKAREKILGPLAAAKNPSGSYDIDVEFDMEMMELEELGDGEPVTAVIAEAPVAPPAARPMWRKVEPGAVRQPPPAATAPAPAPAPAAPPKPAPRPQPAPAPPPKPASPTSPHELSEARKREIYGRYVEAKRARGESTVGITYESLSRSLRESSEKLREKHGKNVDFEVIVKDGKTILKPILK